jgi:hypothetical protein
MEVSRLPLSQFIKVDGVILNVYVTFLLIRALVLMLVSIKNRYVKNFFGGIDYNEK